MDGNENKQEMKQKCELKEMNRRGAKILEIDGGVPQGEGCRGQPGRAPKYKKSRVSRLSAVS